MFKHVTYSRVAGLMIAGVLWTAALPAMARVDLARSHITATGRQLGVPMELKFGKFDARVHYDPANLAASSVRIDLDVSSVDIGGKEYNDELKKQDWFDVARYPWASFDSSAFRARAGGGVNVTGKLTIKGITREVTVPVAITQHGASRVLEGALPIRRSVFRIGEGEWKDVSVVADEVMLRFRVATIEP